MSDRAGAPSERRKASIRQAIGIGSVLLVAGTAAWIAADRLADPGTAGEAVVMREVSTQNGQRAEIRLSDGTTVKLNVASSLEMPVHFGENTREVSLSGEAFFEVAPDKDRPFLINAGNARIEVMGTAFNITAYDEEDYTDVMVTEGLVAVKGSADPASPVVRLESGYLARLDRDDNRIMTRRVSADAHIGWLDGRLHFRDAPFREVVSRLTRWYNFEITVADSRIEDLRLTASFDEETPGEILRVIAASLDLDLERKWKKVHFKYRAGRP